MFSPEPWPVQVVLYVCSIITVAALLWVAYCWIYLGIIEPIYKYFKNRPKRIISQETSDFLGICSLVTFIVTVFCVISLIPLHIIPGETQPAQVFTIIAIVMFGLTVIQVYIIEYSDVGKKLPKKLKLRSCNDTKPIRIADIDAKYKKWGCYWIFITPKIMGRSDPHYNTETERDKDYDRIQEFIKAHKGPEKPSAVSGLKCPAVFELEKNHVSTLAGKAETMVKNCECELDRRSKEIDYVSTVKSPPPDDTSWTFPWGNEDTVEQKFKAGDKVIMVGNNYQGKYGTILELTGGHPILYNVEFLDKDSYWASKNDMKLSEKEHIVHNGREMYGSGPMWDSFKKHITETEKKIAESVGVPNRKEKVLKFKVGDRVECIESCSDYRGHKGTVASVNLSDQVLGFRDDYDGTTYNLGSYDFILINKESKMNFLKDYGSKHKDALLTLGVIIVIDHVFLNGAVREKIKELVSKILAKTETKLLTEDK